MTAPLVTLTEFLLARIAEDEAVAGEAVTEIERVEWVPGAEPSTTDVEPLWVDPNGIGVHVAASPGRVLAECEAKRQIVEYATGQHTSSPEGWDILHLLSLPYAEHPDFREEWRP